MIHSKISFSSPYFFRSFFKTTCEHIACFRPKEGEKRKGGEKNSCQGPRTRSLDPFRLSVEPVLHTEKDVGKSGDLVFQILI